MTRVELRKWWMGKLQNFDSNSDSFAAFCRTHGLKYQTALSWKCKLNLSVDETEKLEFAEINFANGNGDGDFILRRRGWEILIPAHFEAQTLRRLLAVFEEA